jgi:hypothetical protein
MHNNVAGSVSTKGSRSGDDPKRPISLSFNIFKWNFRNYIRSGM